MYTETNKKRLQVSRLSAGVFVRIEAGKGGSRYATRGSSQTHQPFIRCLSSAG
jgi:hypothetical protein